jgi:hypothetical protein
MLKVKPSDLEGFERSHPGIRTQILRIESALLPACPACDSTNTADVEVGLVGRTLSIASATTKFHLVPYGPKPGDFFCRDCRRYFDNAGPMH